MGKLDGKIALITGAGSGIGRATAIEFSKEGAKIAVVDFDSAGGKETVSMVQGIQKEALFFKADVSNAAEVEKMVKSVMDAYGKIDILLNNAGIQGPIGPVEHLPEEDWDRIIDIDLKSVYLCSKYVIPIMISQGSGNIINTSSAAGLVGMPFMPAYCAAKGGVVQITKSLALSYAKDNIRINCVCPGAVKTNMIDDMMPEDPTAREIFEKGSELPGGRWEQPEEIAKAILFLASEDSSAANGTILALDLGHTAS